MAFVSPSRRRHEIASTAVCNSAGDFGAGSHAHGRCGRAVRRFGDQQNGKRAGGLRIRGVQGFVPGGVARRSQRHHDLPSERRIGKRVVSQCRRATTDTDRRIRLDAAPKPTLSSLRWPGRPALAAGNPAWTYMLETPFGKFAIFIGHVENDYVHAFEVWVNGDEQPRGIGAVAKTLSMDMRARDRVWLRMKLDIISRTAGDEAFDCAMPPDGRLERCPSVVAAFARIVRWRIDQLGALTEHESAAPVFHALFAKKEPKTGTDGTMSWTADVYNPSSGDDFVLMLKELVLPGGQRRPPGTAAGDRPVHRG